MPVGQSKNKLVHARIPREVCEAVDREAARLSISRAAALRKIIEKEIELPEPGDGEDASGESGKVIRFPLTSG
jgi:hypothetical protein